MLLNKSRQLNKREIKMQTTKLNLEINKELVLSTCHVREGEVELVEDRNYSYDGCNTRLHVQNMIEDFDDNYPTANNLKNCLELAKSLDCKWLVLDCDGPEVEFLEKFDW